MHLEDMGLNSSRDKVQWRTFVIIRNNKLSDSTKYINILAMSNCQLLMEGSSPRR
jgi:hypothetical protein